MLTYWSAIKPKGMSLGAARPCAFGAGAPRSGSQAGMSFDGTNVGITTRPLGLGAGAG